MKKRYLWPVIAAVLVVFTICLIITVAHPAERTRGRPPRCWRQSARAERVRQALGRRAKIPASGVWRRLPGFEFFG